MTTPAFVRSRFGPKPQECEKLRMSPFTDSPWLKLPSRNSEDADSLGPPPEFPDLNVASKVHVDESAFEFDGKADIERQEKLIEAKISLQELEEDMAKVKEGKGLQRAEGPGSSTGETGAAESRILDHGPGNSLLGEDRLTQRDEKPCGSEDRASDVSDYETPSTPKMGDIEARYQSLVERIEALQLISNTVANSRNGLTEGTLRRVTSEIAVLVDSRRKHLQAAKTRGAITTPRPKHRRSRDLKIVGDGGNDSGGSNSSSEELADPRLVLSERRSASLGPGEIRIGLRGRPNIGITTDGKRSVASLVGEGTGYLSDSSRSPMANARHRCRDDPCTKRTPSRLRASTANIGPRLSEDNSDGDIVGNRSPRCYSIMAKSPMHLPRSSIYDVPRTPSPTPSTNSTVTDLVEDILSWPRIPSGSDTQAKPGVRLKSNQALNLRQKAATMAATYRHYHRHHPPPLQQQQQQQQQHRVEVSGVMTNPLPLQKTQAGILSFPSMPDDDDGDEQKQPFNIVNAKSAARSLPSPSTFPEPVFQFNSLGSVLASASMFATTSSSLSRSTSGSSFTRGRRRSCASTTSSNSSRSSGFAGRKPSRHRRSSFTGRMTPTLLSNLSDYSLDHYTPATSFKPIHLSAPHSGTGSAGSVVKAGRSGRVTPNRRRAGAGSMAVRHLDAVQEEEGSVDDDALHDADTHGSEGNSGLVGISRSTTEPKLILSPPQFQELLGLGLLN
ncbi:hypothetical protein EV182_004287, partial [Spiromyces aspiralis]